MLYERVERGTWAERIKRIDKIVYDADKEITAFAREILPGSIEIENIPIDEGYLLEVLPLNVYNIDSLHFRKYRLFFQCRLDGHKVWQCG